MLAIRDSGVGMDEATRARAFEPFYTTKPQGKGTGLGLSTVYGIVKQSSGFVKQSSGFAWIDSTVGRGTTVTVYLPRATGEALSPGAPKKTAAPGGTAVAPRPGTGTILVVEDNPSLRKVATRMLESGGYTVLGAGTGPEALSLLARQAGPVSLVLTDVVMPGMNGRELAEQIAESHPEIRVVFMSGYTEDAVLLRGVSEAHMAFIGKPFSKPQLLEKVHQVLNS